MTNETRPRARIRSPRPGSVMLQKTQSGVAALALVTYASLHGAQRCSMNLEFGSWNLELEFGIGIGIGIGIGNLELEFRTSELNRVDLLPTFPIPTSEFQL